MAKRNEQGMIMAIITIGWRDYEVQLNDAPKVIEMLESMKEVDSTYKYGKSFMYYKKDDKHDSVAMRLSEWDILTHDEMLIAVEKARIEEESSATGDETDGA